MTGPAPVCQPGWRNHGGFSEPTVLKDVGWDPVPANPFSRDACPPSHASMSHHALSIRIRPENPNHHLFNNHGTWWIHFTIHHADCTKARIRRFTCTGNLVEARRRQYQLLGDRVDGGGIDAGTWPRPPGNRCRWEAMALSGGSLA